MNKNLEYYLNLPWSYAIKWSDEDGCYVASIAELDGCMSHGDTLGEATSMIKDALRCHLNAMLKDNTLIPEPLNVINFKGSITYRTTPEKHYKLVKRAQRKGKSLNKFIDEVLDEKLRETA
ncbi:MAG: type II toxin-antitoxin system HicB family antitoxin [Candidatus Gastranaerophilaceae bacterium]